MVLRLSTSIEDYVDYNVHYTITNKRTQKSMRNLRIIMLACALMFVALFIMPLIQFGYDYAELDWSLFIFISVAIAYAIFLPRVYRSRIIKLAQRIANDPENKIYFMESEITVDDEGIRSVNKKTESSYKWSVIPKWEELNHFFYIYISGIQAFIIPKRLINSEQQDEVRHILTTKCPQTQIQK